MTFADLAPPSVRLPLDGCPVCGGAACPHPLSAHPIDRHRPMPDEPHTTPADLGHPRGIFVRLDGTLQDGAEDGVLLHGPADLIPLSEARRLGLLPSAPDASEQRAVHGPLEDRAEHLREDRRRGGRRRAR